MKVVASIFLLFLVVSTSVAHYPISPRPLRKLIIEADNIIIGYVDDIKTVKAKTKKSVDEHSVAVVRVLKLLKGSMEEQIIEIPYDPYVICPAPPFYAKSTNVLVFLNKNRNGDGYNTYARSYGAKTLDSVGVVAYQNRIIEMMNILNVKDENVQFIETVEWLVKCAENPATRWEGTYELSPESDFMSYYDRNPGVSFRYMISAEQKLRLKNALLSNCKTDYDNLGLIDLVYAENKEDVFKFLCEGLHEIENIYLATEYMRRICLVKDTPELKGLLARLDNLQYSYKKEDQKEINSILNNFKKEIDKR